MMIRINLLPVRQVKKRELGRQFLVLIGVVVLGAALGNYVWWSGRNGVAERQDKTIQDTNARIAELEKQIGEVNKIRERTKEVNKKLEGLATLRKKRSGPVRMLDALTVAIPKKVWISEFTEKSSAVRITGRATSHEDVAEFMRGLAAVVWTPRGLGRVIEHKRDSSSVRVELLAQEGAMEDYQLSEIGTFFTNIDLKKADTTADKSVAITGKRVDFEIGLSANYAI